MSDFPVIEDAVTALPIPSRHLDVAFYFDDTQKYGNKTHEIIDSSNTHYAWAWRYAANSEDGPEIWIPGLVDSCQRAVDKKRKIHLNIDLTWPTPTKDVLKALSPFKNSVVSVEIADEPKWNAAATKQHCKQVRSDLKACDWPTLPLMITYSTKQFPIRAGKNKPYDSVDEIGIEAYVDPPGDHNSPYNQDTLKKYLNNTLEQVERDKKECRVIQQSYSRNYSWREIGHPDVVRWPSGIYLEPDSKAWRQAVKTMVDLCKPVYEIVRENKRVKGLYFFSWERWSGAREYPALAKEVLRIGAAAIKGK